MWIIVTEEDQRRMEAFQREQLARAIEEARKKAEARKAWVEAKTCPHCGQCPLQPAVVYVRVRTADPTPRRAANGVYRTPIRRKGRGGKDLTARTKAAGVLRTNGFPIHTLPTKWLLSRAGHFAGWRMSARFARVAGTV
jgi:hypothetical protein